MMKKLKNEVEKAVAFELSEANRNYPLFASRHEGLAVIAEEVFEAAKEATDLADEYEILRYNVFGDEDDSLSGNIEKMRKHAVFLACEAIQVAAMCDKWKLGGRDDCR